MRRPQQPHCFFLNILSYTVIRPERTTHLGYQNRLTGELPGGRVGAVHVRVVSAQRARAPLHRPTGSSTLNHGHSAAGSMGAAGLTLCLVRRPGGDPNLSADDSSLLLSPTASSHGYAKIYSRSQSSAFGHC